MLLIGSGLLLTGATLKPLGSKLSVRLRTSLAMLVIASLIGCAAATAPRRSCLLVPPPTLVGNPDAGVDVGGEATCPKEYEACLSKLAVDEIEHREGTLRRYAQSAWDQCGAQPATER
jgi:hypothetical protein